MTHNIEGSTSKPPTGWQAFITPVAAFIARSHNDLVAIYLFADAQASIRLLPCTTVSFAFSRRLHQDMFADLVISMLQMKRFLFSNVQLSQLQSLIIWLNPMLVYGVIVWKDCTKCTYAMIQLAIEIMNHFQFFSLSWERNRKKMEL